MARPSPETNRVTEIAWYSSRGGAPTYSTSSYNALERTWSGSVTPDFRAKRIRGEFIPPLAYSSNVIRRFIPLTLVHVEENGWSGRPTVSSDLYLKNIGAADAPVGLFGSDTVNDANNMALRKLSSRLQGVQADLALIFVERRQTADLIASSATRLASAAVALKRADFKGFAKSLNLSARDSGEVARGWKRVARSPVDKRLANHWLEYVFGWLPLLSDIHESAELLAESVSTYREPKGLMRASSRKTASYAYRDSRTGLGHMFADCDARLSVTARLIAVYELDSEARSVLSKTGISNPLSLAWEALPFSFVVDWFLPVGNYLDSLTAFDGFAFKSVTASTLENAVAEWRFGLYNQPGNSSFATTPGGKASATQSRYIRSLSLPGYSFPTFRNPIGSAPLLRFLTASALLLQLFRGETPPEPRRPREFKVNRAW